MKILIVSFGFTSYLPECATTVESDQSWNISYVSCMYQWLSAIQIGPLFSAYSEVNLGNKSHHFQGFKALLWMQAVCSEHVS